MTHKGYLHPNNDRGRAHMQVTQSVSSFQGVASILDVGCGVGGNLIKLREFLPKAKLTGVDINATAIASTKEYFATNNDKNVVLKSMDLTKLKDFNDDEFDVVFTDAVLMFIAPSDIDNVIQDFIRIARQGIVLHEYHQNSLKTDYFDGGRWVYDYVQLFEKHHPNAKVEIRKSVVNAGSWSTYGNLIKINL
ncbi:hypothetical protein MNB_SUP05-SYMBIONT-5-102 [hydrothermal vent metagenome]|uniref:Methyltransferase domain-containing protein n=1 Tax=hydrothermal vent metagenome TaxID=652676 RepID=A0A1W1E0L1_9ZZZZ